MSWDWKERLRPHEMMTRKDHAEGVGDRSGNPDHYHRARTELEGKQLDAKERCRYRRPEHGTHPGGSAGDEQAASLCRSEMEELSHN